MSHHRLRSRAAVAALGVVAVATLASCDSSAAVAPTASGQIAVVAGENFWGDIAQQIGGARVSVRRSSATRTPTRTSTSPTPQDAAAIAAAQLVIENGAGLRRLHGQAARRVAELGPRGAHRRPRCSASPATNPNPHIWYDTARLPDGRRGDRGRSSSRLDPADAATFAANAARPSTPACSRCSTVIADDQGASTPATAIAYTERVPGLPRRTRPASTLGTPASFAQAIEDGNDPSPPDTAAFDSDITDHTVQGAALQRPGRPTPRPRQIKALADARRRADRRRDRDAAAGRRRLPGLAAAPGHGAARRAGWLTHARPTRRAAARRGAALRRAGRCGAASTSTCAGRVPGRARPERRRQDHAAEGAARAAAADRRDGRGRRAPPRARQQRRSATSRSRRASTATSPLRGRDLVAPRARRAPLRARRGRPRAVRARVDAGDRGGRRDARSPTRRSAAVRRRAAAAAHRPGAARRPAACCCATSRCCRST